MIVIYIKNVETYYKTKIPKTYHSVYFDLRKNTISNLKGQPQWKLQSS